MRYAWKRLLLVVPVVALAVSLPAASRASAAGPNAMALDADPATAGVQTALTVGSGATFAIDIQMTTEGTPYSSVQWEVTWTDNRLDWDGGPVTYTAPTGLPSCLDPVLDTGPGAGLPAGLEVLGEGSACFTTTPGVTSTFTGQFVQLNLVCVSDGSATIHLVSLQEDSSFGSGTSDASGTITTTLGNDLSIQCGSGPTDTPTPTITATPTMTPNPSPTPCLAQNGCTPTVTPTIERVVTRTSTATPPASSTATSAPPPPGETPSVPAGGPGGTGTGPQPGGAPGGVIRLPNTGSGGGTSAGVNLGIMLGSLLVVATMGGYYIKQRGRR